MNNLRLFFLSLCFFANVGFSFSQNSKIDSCLLIIKKNKKDTLTVNAYNNLAWELRNNDLEGGLKNIDKGISIATEIKWNSGLRKCYYTKGNLLYKYNKYNEAITFLKKSLAIAEKNNQVLAMAESYNGLGLVYDDMGKHSDAVNSFFSALKYYEIQKYKTGLTRTYGNLGNVYYDMKEFTKADKYHRQSMVYARETKDTTGMINVMVNRGLIKQETEQIDSAIHYFEQAYNLAIKIKNSDHITDAINNNLGAAYMRIDQYDKSLEYLQKVYDKNLSLGRKDEIALNAGNIGLVYYYQGNYSMGEKYLLITRDVAREINLKDVESQAESLLSELNAARGDYKKAFDHYLNYEKLQDSINNLDEQKKIAVRETEFKNQQKATADSLQRLKEDAEKKFKHDREVQQQKFYTYAGIGIALVAFGFLLFVYRGLRQKKRANALLEEKNLLIQKQKKDVEEQKHIIEEKQKEITDSINYAKRIQYSLLAHDEMLNKYLNEYFVLFKPKDIVSGDFYWCTQRDNDFYLAICDCTGHGVPGAFMSLLNISFLNEAINEKNIRRPNEVLDFVRDRLIKNMEGGKDGMDAILIRLMTGKMEFAAAHNRPVLVRNNELTELPADKMPVGKGEKTEPFTLHTIELHKDDRLYFFTDGYADQFGGEKGKKFKYSQLQKLIFENSLNEMNAQLVKLNQQFEGWKGELEQVDDVCVIGIKI